MGEGCGETLGLYGMQWRTQEFCSGGIQQIQLRIEDRERESRGGSPLPPRQGFWSQL